MYGSLYRYVLENRTQRAKQLIRWQLHLWTLTVDDNRGNNYNGHVNVKKENLICEHVVYESN